MNFTGWIAYTICDKSGIGSKTPNYLHLPWAEASNIGEIREHILHEHENWAVFSDSYSMNIELENVIPPRSEVLKYMHELEQKQKDIDNTIQVLMIQLDLMLDEVTVA